MNKQELVNTLINDIFDKQGTSLDLNGNRPNKGFMVAKARHHEMTFDLNSHTGLELKEFVDYYVTTHSLLLKLNKDLYLGAWVDDNNLLYLDLSENVQELRLARLLAKNRRQLAIYDLNKNRSLAV